MVRGVCKGMSDRDDDLRGFLLVVRDALLMVVRWIERRYGLRAAK